MTQLTPLERMKLEDIRDDVDDDVYLTLRDLVLLLEGTAVPMLGYQGMSPPNVVDLNQLQRNIVDFAKAREREDDDELPDGYFDDNGDD